jgi:hypothetical protein
LVRELARSGGLPPGYPKLSEVPWPSGGCNDRNLVNVESRYFIHLTEIENNYIEIPLCPRTALDSAITIQILPIWPWAVADDTGAQLFIGMIRGGVFNERHELEPGQRDLILEALQKMGVKLYVNEHMRDVLEQREK